MNQAMATASTAPWWGTPLLAGIFVVAGVLTGQLLTWLSDSRKAKREDQTRWLADRRQVYAAYLSVLEQFRLHAWNIYDRGEWNDQEWDDLVETIVLPRAELKLVASAEVVKANESVLDAAGTFVLMIRHAATGPLGESAELRAFDDSVDNLRDGARRDLGMDPAGD